MSFWIRPASMFPRFFEECMRDFRHMERVMLTPLLRTIPQPVDRYASEIVNDESRFTVSVDVSEFKPENLKVNVHGHRLTIEGKEELKEGNGFSMRSFTRRFVLPENVDLNAIRTFLTDNGQLSVEVPRLNKPLESGGRSIPIEQVGEKS
uniref:Putative Heat Shock Protein n=1 Tax=Angiostrongylus cantonensis TaxID=6313 RepID=C7BVR3_ANGCA|nr:putative Heat Shock Protein [Angiostrongylus cantonensis]